MMVFEKNLFVVDRDCSMAILLPQMQLEEAVVAGVGGVVYPCILISVSEAVADMNNSDYNSSTITSPLFS